MSSKLSSASTARKSLHDAALDPTGSSSSSGSDAAPSEEEDEEELENVSQGNGSSRRRYRQRIHFNVEQLQAVYHLPLKTYQL
ncbi:hypothetical protein PHYBOEH_009012 [Phytophthora boehmeriae]|uniref:Uncharacterized protein n=1 Tax=Phytophthora boehmeriae TaxID=109152 RepID=A0A8T1VVY4_9STRA|nr:hypothetical protein PHYBOEH_009012 [Phytophthora boehmeriae]